MPTEDEFKLALGARIRTVRRGRRMSQAELAEAVGLPRTSLIQVEKGTQNVSAFVLVSLANKLEIDVMTLLFGEPEAKAAPKLPARAPQSIRRWVTDTRLHARSGGRPAG